MKKIVVSVCILSILIISAVGCSPSTSSQAQASATQVDVVASSNNGSYLSTSFTDASPVQIQLAVGTLKLEGSGEAIDVQTAAELLPLWQAVNSLGSSDTTSAVEMQAIYKQIQETMSAAQVQAIAKMQVTSQMAAQYALEAGMVSQVGAPAGDIAAAQASNTASGGQSGGSMPVGDPGMGGPPDGGMGPGTGGGGVQNGTTGGASGVQAMGIENILVEAVIELLQTKAA
jgi:hypothetical protein